VHSDRVLLLRDDGDLAERGIAVPGADGYNECNVNPVDPAAAPPEADAQITAIPGVALLCLVADCCAVYLFDRRQRVIALAHAGWRGMVAGIGAKCLALMASEYGTRAEDCLAALSPCAGPCCYEVGEEVYEEVRRRFPGEWEDLLHPTRPGHWRLDLAEANLWVLQQAGVSRENIIASRQCTICCSDLFFSHRGEGGVTGRMGAVLMIEATGKLEPR
jgi:YfiH family protein